MSARNPESGLPVIGGHISWERIEKLSLLVTTITELARVEGTWPNVKVHGLHLEPYALLTVEIPDLKTNAILPVVHRVDFLHVYAANGFLEEGQELIAFYAPDRSGLKRFLWKWFPRLHLYVFPEGHLNEMNAPDFEPESWSDWARPLADWSPE